jgi:hypothetical protein
MKELIFKNWLTRKYGLNESISKHYAKAIHKISAHYSLNNNINVDLYSLKSTEVIKEILKDYKSGGQYAEFNHGYHNLFSAALDIFCNYKSDNFKLKTTT